MAIRNPPWSRDELILALALYMQHRPRLPSKGGAEVVELSEILNKLHRQLGNTATADLRNPAGCYMKLQNFRRFDPDYTSTGRKGLKAGNKEEGPVWDLYAGSPEHLAATAKAIRAAIEGAGEVPLAAPQSDNADEPEAEEGRLLSRLHTFRERNRAIVQKRKDAAAKLACEVCDFDFQASYGEHGRGFIECHHTRPLHTLRPSDRTRLSELALVCANCHRMLHARRPWLTIEELRELVQSTASPPSKNEF